MLKVSFNAYQEVVMTQSEKTVLRRLRRILSDKLGDSDLELRLFGSKARGDDTSDSDKEV